MSAQAVGSLIARRPSASDRPIGLALLGSGLTGPFPSCEDSGDEAYLSRFGSEQHATSLHAHNSGFTTRTWTPHGMGETVFEQWGTIIEVVPFSSLKYSLIAPRPDLTDSPENYFFMTFRNEEDAGSRLTLSVPTSSLRESVPCQNERRHPVRQDGGHVR